MEAQGSSACRVAQADLALRGMVVPDAVVHRAARGPRRAASVVEYRARWWAVNQQRRECSIVGLALVNSARPGTRVWGSIKRLLEAMAVAETTFDSGSTLGSTSSSGATSRRTVTNGSRGPKGVDRHGRPHQIPRQQKNQRLRAAAPRPRPGPLWRRYTHWLQARLLPSATASDFATLHPSTAIGTPSTTNSRTP